MCDKVHPERERYVHTNKSKNIVANSGAGAVRAHMRAALTMLILALAVAHAARWPQRVPPRALQVRAMLSPATIARACDSGMFTAAQLEYLRASKNSGDARDVAWHRAVTRLVNAHAPERVANNLIMHPLDDDEEARHARAHRRIVPP